MRFMWLLALILLTSCAAKRVVVVPLTPPLIGYTDAQQKAVAEEIRGCDCPTTKIMLGDYGATRDAIRALNKKKGPK